MKNTKNMFKGFLLLALLLGVVVATPAKADNNNVSLNGFLNAQASLKADALVKLESSAGVVLSSGGSLRVMSANVTSVTGGDVNATVPFGNSVLNFVVKTDAQTKLNGKLLTNSAVVLGQLKVGDKVSFSGTVTSSTSSSIVVDADHLVARALYNTAKVENKTTFQGEVKAVNTADSSFTLQLKNGVSTKVAVNTSTAVTVDGTTSTLSALLVGEEVKVTGELNAEGTVVTASKVVAESDRSDKDDKDKGDDNKKDNGKRNVGFFGRMMNWFWK